MAEIIVDPNLVKALKDADANINKMSMSTQKLGRALKSGRLNVKQLTRTLSNFRKEIQEVGKTEIKGDLGTGKLTKEIKDSADATNNLAKGASNAKKSTEDLGKSQARQGNEAQKAAKKQREYTDEVGRSKSAMDVLSNAIGRFVSVTAITNFVKKLVQVRGEFELQQKSLEILLQSKEKADELWDKTVALAMKSPFSVMQLVKSTKQLAAYRVEADKLYETNKMLSDISAGLGVDMNRLILAFGQVKAANYLRGTELRQFSEAGLNILGELSQYYTELEGRTVTVGEVFERVSARMVSFGDVETILKKVTSEGGVFFDMQAKQAETLKGKLSNLKDAWQLFLNALGEENSDSLKGIIDSLREIIKHSETFWNWFKTIGAGFLIFANRAKLASAATWLFSDAIATITGKQVAANQKTSKISNFISKNLSSGIQGALSGIQKVNVAIQRLFSSDFWVKVTNGLKASWKKATDFLSTSWKNVGSKIKTTTQNIGGTLRSLPTKIGEITKSIKTLSLSSIRLSNVGNAFKVLANRVRHLNLATIFNKGIDALKNFIATSNIAGKVLSTLGSIIGGVAQMAVGLGLGLIISKFMSVAYEAQAAREEVRKFNQELESIRITNVKEFESSVTALENMVNSLENLSMGTEEYRDAINDIKEEYGDYFNMLIDENTAYEDLAGAIDGATEALKRHQAQKMLSELNQKTEEKYGEKYADVSNRLETYLTKYGIPFFKDPSLVKEYKQKGLFGKYYSVEDLIDMGYGGYANWDDLVFDKDNTIKLTDIHVQRVLTAIENEIKRQVEEGEELSYDKINQIIRDTLGIKKKFLNVQESLQWRYYMQGLYDIIAAQEEDFQKNEAKVEASFEGTSYYAVEYNNYIRQWEERVQELREYIKNEAEFEKEYIKLLHERENVRKAFSFAKEKKYSIAEMWQEFFGGGPVTSDDTEIGEYETRTALIKQLDKEVVELAKTMKVSDILLNKAFTGFERGKEVNIGQIIEEFTAQYEEAKKQLDILETAVNKGTIERTDDIKEKIDRYSNEANWWEAVLAILGIDPSKDKDEKNKVSEAKRLIDEMRRRYEELIKYYEKNVAAGKVESEYETLFQELFGSKYSPSQFDLADKNSIISFIDMYLDQEAAALTDKEKRAWMELRAEFASTAEIDAIEEMLSEREKKIEEAFRKYDLYKEFGKLGISKDKASKLLGIDLYDLDELQKAIKPYLDEIRNSGTEGAKIVQEAENKINNIIDNTRKERIKKYAKYIALSLSDMAKIDMNLYEDLKELYSIDDKELSRTDKENIGKRLKEEAIIKKEKETWQMFKSSDFYTMMFSDLNQLSDETLSLLTSRLQELQHGLSHLDATQFKDIVTQLNKLRSIIIERDPFAAVSSLRESISKGAEKAFDGIDFYSSDALAEALNEGTLELENQRRTLDLMQQAKKLLDDGNTIMQDVLPDDVLRYYNLGSEALAKQITDQTSAIENTESQNEKLSAQLELLNLLTKALQKVQNTWSNIMKDISNIAQKSSEILQSLNVDEDSSIFETIESIELLASTASDIINLETKLDSLSGTMKDVTASFGYIGIALSVVQGIINIVNGYKEAKLEAKLEHEQKIIDNLKNSYERLSESFDEAFNLSTLERYNTQLKNNLNLTLTSLQAQLSALESAKDTDENREKIEDVKKEIEDIQDSLSELEDERLSKLTSGVFDDILSAAESFVDAWLSAFEETGDGLSGLEDQFQNTLKNVVKRQVALQFVGNYVQGWSDTLNSMFASGGELTPEEISDYAETIRQEFPELSERLEEFFKALGSTLDGTGSLSGLEKGIQGITEATAEVIASYLNSLRFYVADSNSRLVNIERFIGNDEKTNPMLEQLKIIAAQTSAIHTLLKGVTSSSGQYIRVELKES